MKRGFSESPSSSGPPPSSRFKPNPEGDSQFLEDESTKNFARKVADHYSRRTNQTLEEREASPIIHLKKLNNWIKSVLIQLYARPDDAVLDLACGKGGDLIKWDKARIGYYVGIDIAEGSIEDCRTRYNGDADHHQRRKKFSFPSRLLCGDCFEVELDKILEEDAPFDICSCQFAMHYSWTTEARARRALANVSALLRPGGVFIGTMPDANVIIKKLREAEGLEIGNSVYWIRFGEEYSRKKFKSSSPFGIEYVFHLEDAVDCPEWIVPFNVFKSLAEESVDNEILLWEPQLKENSPGEITLYNCLEDGGISALQSFAYEDKEESFYTVSWACGVNGNPFVAAGGVKGIIRVIDVNNEMIHKAGRLENVVGWYHSHPGYGCRLSGIDVSTQMLNQQYQEPFLAVVIDPTRTVSAGKVEIGALRTYPEGHKILNLLWTKYWLNTLSSSPLLGNGDYVAGKISDLAETVEQAQSQLAHSRFGGIGASLHRKKEDEPPLAKITRDSAKINVEQVHGLTSQVIRDILFNSARQSERTPSDPLDPEPLITS